MEIQTHAAPQNDRLNLSFVKGIHVGAEKCSQMVENWQFLKLFFSSKIEKHSYQKTFEFMS